MILRSRKSSGPNRRWSVGPEDFQLLGRAGTEIRAHSGCQPPRVVTVPVFHGNRQHPSDEWRDTDPAVGSEIGRDCRDRMDMPERTVRNTGAVKGI